MLNMVSSRHLKLGYEYKCLIGYPLYFVLATTLNNMEEKLFSKIMVEIKDGVIVNITELPKDQYEQFLELMHQVRIAYIAVTKR